MSDNNSGKNDLKRKRIGKNGPYEKSLAYITDGRMRRAKEKAKLGQLEKVVYEISLLTKTPVAVMALNSYSQIWIAGTTDKMTEFVSNEELQSKFEMAAKGDSEPYYNFQKKRPTQNIVANEQVDSEQEEFDFPVDWAKFNTLKKRVLVRNLVRWYTETWKPWIPSLKPEWWPDDISFRSTRKSDVSSLDKILNSFLKFRATSSMALFQASDLPVSSEQWAELNWEDFDFPKNWLAKNWSPPKTPIKKNLVSLRHRCLVADTDLEPVRLLTSAECISFALFHDKKFWPFIKLVTITSCLSHIDVLVEWMTNGIGNINQEVIRNLFGSSNLTQLKSNILERTQDSSIFELVGVFLAFGIPVIFETEDGCHKFGDGARRIHLLFHDQTAEYCCLVQSFPFVETEPCSHNISCGANLTTSFFFTCPNCNLKYHNFCAEHDSDCGCASEASVTRTIKENLLQGETCQIDPLLLFKRDRKLEGYIVDILSGTYPGHRTKMVTKLVNNPDAEENIFFMKTMPSSKRKFAVDCIKSSLNVKAKKLIEQRFSVDMADAIVERWLMPEVLVELIKRMARGKCTNLMIERSMYRLSTGLE